MEFKTHIYYMRDGSPEPKFINEAAGIIRSGGTVIFPTETVYGLGADALSEIATLGIFKAKGRPSDNPLIIHVSSLDMLIYLIDENLSEKANLLIEKFWPGPLTLIFKKSKNVPYSVTGGLNTVAVRMPDHPIAYALIKESGRPIAAPSANKSGKPSPTKGNHVISEMVGRVDAIICGDDSRVGLESTVLDMTGDTPMILRPGGITIEQLRDVIGEVLIDSGGMEDNEILLKKRPLNEGLSNGIQLSTEKKVPKAPGMKYAHYAPDAPMYIFKGDSEKVISRINELTAEQQSKGKRVGVLAYSEHGKYFNADIFIGFGKLDKLEEVAANIFSALRDLDKMKLDIIYAESVEESGIGVAIMNRLKKAASNKICFVD